jgi:hypothetical protein
MIFKKFTRRFENVELKYFFFFFFFFLLLCGKDLRERKNKIKQNKNKRINSKASLQCLRLEEKKKYK